ncbi:MAG: histone deacetylase [Acidobacteriota bacterium]
MKAFYCDTFELPLPPEHRFPMSKYRLLRHWLLAQGVLHQQDLALPSAATDEQLLRVHEGEYLRRVVSGTLERKAQRRIGFPWSPALVERSRRSVGGTLAAARQALTDGVAANLAGGTHHAFADRGEGFCVFNDVAVAVRELQASGLARRAVVVDCDVHQGNGTAAIFRDDPSVFTLSLHGAKNYPFRKEVSDLDIALPDGAGDELYLSELARGLDAALAWLGSSRGSSGSGEPSGREEFLGSASDAVAFDVSGADPYEKDRLGRLALSVSGLRERDYQVFSRLRAAGLPVAVVMAGGYAEPVEDIVRIHGGTLQEAKRAARGSGSSTPAATDALARGTGGSSAAHRRQLARILHKD